MKTINFDDIKLDVPCSCGAMTCGFRVWGWDDDPNVVASIDLLVEYAATSLRWRINRAWRALRGKRVIEEIYLSRHQALLLAEFLQKWSAKMEG